jgi:hypothetical protein
MYKSNSDKVKEIIANNCNKYKPPVLCIVRAFEYLNKIIHHEICEMKIDFVRKKVRNPCINHFW